MEAFDYEDEIFEAFKYYDELEYEDYDDGSDCVIESETEDWPDGQTAPHYGHI
jgi:hypothetical protein